MARLDVRRRLRLGPYVVRPGETTDTHVEVRLWRDADTKRIMLGIGTLGIKDGMMLYRLLSPSKRVLVAASPTHAPKVFASFERDLIGSVDRRDGDVWVLLTTFLADNGMSLAAGEGLSSADHSDAYLAQSPDGAA